MSCIEDTVVAFEICYKEINILQLYVMYLNKAQPIMINIYIELNIHHWYDVNLKIDLIKSA